ncbi:hypothetical protein [Bacillus subtilis]|uniref:hypothetical protein n=1 Tax=Bacillus subtilis TaxID=1423 RepID=UPI001560CC7A|nr:hypothetical protein [Bacillus subtilis]NRF01189.1 hypothetical protein [Bacillus subtilis]NRG35480.1 hypothetical protein [Bacillus subtilis]
MKVVASQLAELRNKITEENPDSSITVTSFLLEDKDINGGIDWYEKAIELCVEKNRWVKLTVEESSRGVEWAPGTNRNIKNSMEMSDEEVEGYLNSQRNTPSEEIDQILAFFEKYDIK